MKKTTPKRKPATRRRRAGIGAVKRTTTRRRRRSSMGGLNTSLLLGVAVGAAAAGFLDGPLQNILPNNMLRNGAKVAAGAFLSTKTGMLQGVGLGMVGAGAAQLVQGLTGQINGVPALLGNNNVPALLGAADLIDLDEDEDEDIMGYEADLMGYEANALGDEFGGLGITL